MDDLVARPWAGSPPRAASSSIAATSCPAYRGAGPPAIRPATSSTRRSSRTTAPRSARTRPGQGPVPASPDDHFRPVLLARAPMALLYVVDMARAVIEHPQFMPTELKNRADLLVGKDKGRIWRIVPDSAEGKPKAGPAAPGRRVDPRARSFAWSPQCLVANDGAAAPAGAQRPEGAGAAAGHGRARHPSRWPGSRPPGCSNRSVCSMTIRSSCSRNPTRPASARTRCGWRNPGWPGRRRCERLVALADDPDANVRFQVALCLGGWNDDRIIGPWCGSPGRALTTAGPGWRSPRGAAARRGLDRRPGAAAGRSGTTGRQSTLALVPASCRPWSGPGMTGRRRGHA